MGKVEHHKEKKEKKMCALEEKRLPQWGKERTRVFTRCNQSQPQTKTVALLQNVQENMRRRTHVLIKKKAPIFLSSSLNQTARIQSRSKFFVTFSSSISLSISFFVSLSLFFFFFFFFFFKGQQSPELETTGWFIFLVPFSCLNSVFLQLKGNSKSWLNCALIVNTLIWYAIFTTESKLQHGPIGREESTSV